MSRPCHIYLEVVSSVTVEKTEVSEKTIGHQRAYSVCNSPFGGVETCYALGKYLKMVLSVAVGKNWNVQRKSLVFRRQLTNFLTLANICIGEIQT